MTKKDGQRRTEFLYHEAISREVSLPTLPPPSKPDMPLSHGPGQEDERWKLVDEILASRTFAKAARLCSFLTYICQETLEGRPERVNEQQIGVHVFGRSPSYQAADDSIVRSQARLLRQKLDEYFEHERPNAPLRVSIPKGGYVPVFQRSGPIETPAVIVEAVEAPLPVPAALTPIPVLTEDMPAKRQNMARSKASLSGWVVAAVLLIVLAADVTLRRSPETRSRGPVQAVWSRIFAPDQQALIIASDDALVLLQELTKSQISLNDYLSGSYLENLKAPSGAGPFDGLAPLSASWFNAHQYTSMADLSLATRIVRVSEAFPRGPEIRYARDVNIDDLKNRNVILIGGIGANPWVGLFENQLNFKVKYDWKASRGYVENKSPQKGELASYEETGSDGVPHNYGVLAFLNGIGGTGDALLFEGSGMAGTESAADFLFNQNAFRQFARKIGATSSHMPHFEVLLETASIGGNAPQERIIAYRVLN